MQLRDLGLEDQKTRTTIREMSFGGDSALLVKGLDFRSANNNSVFHLSMPELRLAADLRSTDISRLALQSLLADKTTIHYTNVKGKDTLESSAVAAIRIGNTTLNKGWLQYERAAIDLADATVRKGNMRIHVPAVSLRLSNGRFESKNGQGSNTGQGSYNRPVLSTAVLLTWRDARLGYNKDSMTFAADGISGTFKEDAFHWSPGAKLGWQRLAGNTTIDKGSIRYKGKKITADVTAFSWQPKNRALTFSDFSVVPNESRDTVFSKARWQGDYIDIKGARVSFTGIEFPRESRLSFVRINKVALDGILVNASRDKRIPFQHGLEKLMPTQLINTISFPVC
ncbi:MAG TPA: hypothetical protein VN824_11745, partial [Puia sp.]|nr:hypothetical protein [Puia sp.]